MRKTVLLAALLVALFCSTVLADTVMYAPDGNPLCFGQTMVSCKLNSERPDKTYRCLLMGVWNGVPLVAPIEQQEAVVKNRLYMVTLTAPVKAADEEFKVTQDYGATFDFLERNVIKIDRELSNYLLVGAKAFALNAGRAVQWRNKSTDLRKDQLLLTNQYSQGGFDVFDVQERDELHSGQRQYCPAAATYRTTARIPDSYIVNNIDGIDLAAYAVGDNTGECPNTMIIWCKRANQTGIDGLQLTAPTRLLVAQFDGDKIVSIDQDLEIGYQPAGQAVAEMPDFGNVVGGQLVAPLDNGQLAYCYAYSNGRTTEWKNQKIRLVSEYENKLTTYALPIAVTRQAGQYKIVLGNKQSLYERVRKISFDTTSWGARSKWIANQAKAAGTIWNNTNIQNSGVRMAISKDGDNTVSIEPWLGFPELEHVKHYDSDTAKFIGKLKDITADYSPDKINTNRLLTAPAGNILDEYMLQKSASVYAVMYGWPYHSVAKDVKQKVFPAFSKSEDYVVSSSRDFSNGCSTSMTIGAQKKIPGGPSYRVASNSAYSYSNTQSDSQTQSIKVEYTLNNSGNGPLPADVYANTGAVFYTFNQLTFNSVGKFSYKVNGLDSEAILVPGLSDRPGGMNFEYIFASVALLPRDSDKVMHTCLFDLRDPEQLSKPDDFRNSKNFARNMYSPLSKGLATKPSSRILFDSTYLSLADDVNAIRDFQENVDFESLLDSIKSYGKVKIDGQDLSVGVIPYIQKGGDRSGVVQYTLANDTTVSYGKSIRQSTTTTHSWSEGVDWEYNGKRGFLVGGEVAYNGSVSYSTATEGANGFQMTIPGCITGADETMEYYVAYIDIPALKNDLYKKELAKSVDKKGNPVKFVKPFYVPDYCWDNNNSFMLMIPYIPKQSVASIARQAAKE